ncbi:MAG: RES family NAD+ phosphorylase [Casimicrobiaceae bacterium]
MQVFRITDRRYANHPLDGIGASLAGARWNSRGVRMGYAGGSRALVLLELLVHVSRGSVPASHVIVPIEIPGDAVATPEVLPAGWDRLPYDIRVQSFGDAWIRSGASLGLRVPSAIVKAEWNVLINPAHPRFVDIRIGAAESLVWDQRLFP